MRSILFILVLSTISSFGASQCTRKQTIGIIGMRVEVSEGLVRLSWSCNMSEENSYFLIEKTLDGIRFEAIGTISATENGLLPLNYSYSDVKPYIGISYYRVTQFDETGASSFSELVPVTYTAVNSEVLLFPVPAERFLRVKMNGEKIDSIIIYALDGSKIVEYTVNPFGSDVTEISVNSLKRGTYILSCTAGSKKIEKRFVKN